MKKRVDSSKVLLFSTGDPKGVDELDVELCDYWIHRNANGQVEVKKNRLGDDGLLDIHAAVFWVLGEY